MLEKRIYADASIFSHCHNSGDVSRELAEKIKYSINQAEVDYLDASHIARIKEIRNDK